MIDLNDIRKRPWVLDEFANALGLHALTLSSIMNFLADAQLRWPGLSKKDLPAYREAERRVLLGWTPADRLEALFKKYEAVLKAGNATEFGQLLSRSPYRYDARIVSVLSERARIQNVDL